MATVSKLFANGTFQTSVPLDEISRTRIGQSTSNVFSSEFDEITIHPMTNGLAKRETNSGKFMVAGYFDEYTVNSPVVGPDIVYSGLMVNLLNAPTSGTTWTDSSGNGYNATLIGAPTLTSGGVKLNNSTASGGTDYISVPYNISSNTVTVEVVASFNPTSYWATIWGNESYTASKGYLAFMSSSTGISVGKPANFNTSTITASNAIRHWTFVINGTSVSLYLNGSIVGSAGSILNQTLWSTNNFYFGARHMNDGTSFTDLLNNSTSANQPVFYQMRIYNKSLSSAEITQNYNAVRGTYGI